MKTADLGSAFKPVLPQALMNSSCHPFPFPTSLFFLFIYICSDCSDFPTNQHQKFSFISTCKLTLRESQQPRREFPFILTGTAVKPFRALKYTFLSLLISYFSQPLMGKQITKQLYSFPRLSYHKLSSLRQQKWILS